MWAPRLQHALRTVARVPAARQGGSAALMWAFSRATARWRHGGGEAGILLDVDGVLLRGGSVIPAARRAFRKLLDADGRFLLPVVFVTNAGSCQPQRKAQQLSALLDVRVGGACVCVCVCVDLVSSVVEKLVSASASQFRGPGFESRLFSHIPKVSFIGDSQLPVGLPAIGWRPREQRPDLFQCLVCFVLVSLGRVCNPSSRVQISPDQVVLSYSPLRMLSSFHDKCVLVSGQGPVSDIARSLGFKKVVSVEQLCRQHPLLDMVDHSRRPEPPAERPAESTAIEAVVLFGEPVRWETNLQLLLDVLLTDGRPSRAYRRPARQLPVLACNLDLLWMAQAPSPRLGHGMFLLCLESAYKKLTGADLRYEALLGKPGLLTYRYARRALTRSNLHRRVQTIYAIGCARASTSARRRRPRRASSCTATGTWRRRRAWRSPATWWTTWRRPSTWCSGATSDAAREAATSQASQGGSACRTSSLSQ
ncbi:haloacid dehalogenase-like hydrolase domain-containing 5 isoform X5 [Syngnathoides biaculeatus]|uniref:haloacid dehalogenase-like hydrolase domain-containing 5 isoform X5 n=1 Tax=Syngnathoides biaculeatus TaxID=300417 RepID=UPI002ADE515F|nr:haloacid dehalogenase-like hydrolase domain-containing 5 isoform X5 [Syngnathoides biaculeatus]